MFTTTKTALTPLDACTSCDDAQTGGRPLDPTPSLAVSATRGAQMRRLAERGMVTAEYAVGILAAVALALVLLKVFNDNSVLDALLHYVTQLIGKLGTYIK